MFPEITLYIWNIMNPLYVYYMEQDVSILYMGLIESTTTLYKDREIHPSDDDLQSTTRLVYIYSSRDFILTWCIQQFQYDFNRTS